MAFWLLKTEPSVYSYADLERDGLTMWDGVTNALALLHLRRVAAGDLALIYHTGSEKQIVGLATVTRGFYLNPETDDPKLAVCDVKAHRKFERPLTLARIKTVPQLADWDLLRLGRLSVVPVGEAQWQTLQTLLL